MADHISWAGQQRKLSVRADKRMQSTDKVPLGKQKMKIAKHRTYMQITKTQKKHQKQEEMDTEAIRNKIEGFGKTAEQLAKGIAGRLVGPIPPGLIPMVSIGDADGRVLVAVLPSKRGETMGGEGDPFAAALKAFKEALKDYGPIEDIGV